ncbi:Short-chain type dehydrogenase/reductase [Apostasia shenzhenica]|uniref:Noroxomaritidine/norcraugsodine reductase n=1 Tax=Apostasia shenzhenica TaxID=1088818 RepID=A0A2I0ANE1_9ASPA|nr:Short-chain type dehydrogenase/reductase [Apostasia shenzhenica]
MATPADTTNQVPPAHTPKPAEANGKAHSPHVEPNNAGQTINGPQKLSSPLSLKDRAAIVTGGSGGIGTEICTHLATLGAKLVVAYLGDPAPAIAVVSAINFLTAALPGTRAVAVEADISDEAQVKALFDKAEEAFGQRIHILVAAAGVQDPSYPVVAEATLEQWEKTFAVNARGTFLCCREAARRLVRGGGGRIITMSSSTVGTVRQGCAVYSATKAAVEMMTRVLSKEMKGARITANAVAPGPIRTALFFAGKTEEKVRAAEAENPMGRIGEPADVAPVVGFLASDAGEWVNGQVIRVNGGYI